MKKYGFSALVCLAVYWLSNAVLWIPWKYGSALVGAICMIIYVPIAWGGISILCLRKWKKEERVKGKYMVGLLFTIIAFLSDFIFYVGYRQIPEELYKPATFGAYILCFIAPLLVGKRLQKEGKQKTISNLEWVVAGLSAIIFIDITFYVVRFW